MEEAMAQIYLAGVSPRREQDVTELTWRKPHSLWSSKKAALEKADAAIKELELVKLNEAAKTVENGVEETLACHAFHLSTGGIYAQTT